jgi:predicted N-acetyltransferase YhbS
MNRIRPSIPADSTALAGLSGELGYPATSAQIEERLRKMLGNPDHLVLVAVDDAETPVAWIHGVVRRQLETEPFVQIAGLVVAEAWRSQGIGADLVRQVEDWTRGIGIELVRVRSNVTRTRAHGFYLRAGYSLVKTSHLFAKRVQAPDRAG